MRCKHTCADDPCSLWCPSCDSDAAAVLTKLSYLVPTDPGSALASELRLRAPMLTAIARLRLRDSTRQWGDVTRTAFGGLLHALAAPTATKAHDLRASSRSMSTASHGFVRPPPARAALTADCDDANADVTSQLQLHPVTSSQTPATSRARHIVVRSPRRSPGAELPAADRRARWVQQLQTQQQGPTDMSRFRQRALAAASQGQGRARRSQSGAAAAGHVRTRMTRARAASADVRHVHRTARTARATRGGVAGAGSGGLARAMFQLSTTRKASAGAASPAAAAPVSISIHRVVDDVRRVLGVHDDSASSAAPPAAAAQSSRVQHAARTGGAAGQNPVGQRLQLRITKLRLRSPPATLTSGQGRAARHGAGSELRVHRRGHELNGHVAAGVDHGDQL